MTSQRSAPVGNSRAFAIDSGVGAESKKFTYEIFGSITSNGYAANAPITSSGVREITSRKNPNRCSMAASSARSNASGS